MTNPRVLLVDDAPDVQLIARKALERGFEVVPAHTLSEASDRLSEGVFDLIILDVQLPDGSGFDFCAKLNKSPGKGTPPIIMLTSKSEIQDKLQGFSAGAEDYVVKPFDPAELRARAELRLRKRREENQLPSSGSSSLSFGDIAFDPKGDGVTIEARDGKTFVSLTHREFRLLLCLARGNGSILSRDQIITGVWDGQTQITGRTVDTHICKLRKKISSSRFTIHSVYGAGYRFVEPAN